METGFRLRRSKNHRESRKFAKHRKIREKLKFVENKILHIGLGD